ncbi:MAG: helix-turn-helix domain-containing protein [bacterium]|nr:helix-turn-helix domain-containing protein [bacterium]
MGVNKPSILIVHPDPDLRWQLEALFGQQYSIYVAQTDKSAINYFTKHPISASFIATKPNKNNGVELVQQLHKINPASALFLIISEPIESIPVFWLRLPVERILIAPFDFAEVKIAVDNAICLKDKRETRICEIFHYILAHYHQPEFHIGELSQKMQLHRSSLEKWFTRNTGISLEHCLLDLRISLAKLKLMEPKSLAKQVYTAVGFHTYQTFAKQFKIHTGLTPRQYKQKMKSSQKHLLL